MTKATMADWLGLQETLMTLDGRTPGQAGEDKAKKVKLAAGTRMYLRAVMDLMQPYMKAYTDEMQERIADLTSGKAMTAEQHFEAQDIDRELRNTEVEIGLPKHKHPAAELNLEETQIGTVDLVRLQMVFSFPDELVETGGSDPTTVFKSVRKPRKITQAAELA